ncbi:uncharacterized membrane protein YhaH (DUF805 family) [Natronocella acetinitrilica]|uniref:Uncharacterized membrane protein YhaH (DUF805 family) n=2 Tax=Natronocella acetinitrilica TaxID=414046 RepID=A0AAE3KFV5_9GAMM|nr:uncharacterized membrane protein YhaH (DUF805 family) [Natronocella acetinitrilica]
MLIHVLIGFGLIIFDVFTGTFVMEVGLGAFSALYSVASVFPSFAVGARRLHDINFRGWWQVLLVVPLLGVTILCVLFALRSNPGENRFGDHPLAQAG